MPVVIKLIAWADPKRAGPLWCAGQYVESVDVQQVPHLDWLIATPHLSKALRFFSMRDALQTYREVLTRAPRRYDGKPNRPMTAMTVEFIQVPPKEQTPK